MFGKECVTLDERGKIVFPPAEEIKGNKDLEKMKEHWESFVASEDDDRKKYLRSLEVQFSMNSMVNGKKTEEATEFMTDVFAEKKLTNRKRLFSIRLKNLKTTE